MDRHNSYAPLRECPILLIVFGFLITVSSGSSSSPVWSNKIQDFSLKIHQTRSDSDPLNEGFMLLTGSQKRSSSTISLPTTGLILVNRIFPASNISSTTSNSLAEIDDHPSSNDYRHKRSYEDDRLMGTALRPVPPDNDEELASLLKANDDQFDQQLIDVDMVVDGSGLTTESTFTTTTTTIMLYETPVNLSDHSVFLITVDCANANNTLNQILTQFPTKFNHSYTVESGYNEFQCSDSGKLNLTLDFVTSTDITVINDIFEVLDTIQATNRLQKFTVDRCGDGRTVLITNVIPCYFANLCYLCGREPERGVCSQSSGLSTCSCFPNVDDPSRPYQGDRCYPADPKPIAQFNSLPRWTPIVIGVLAGLAGLFAAIACCLGLVFLWRHRPPMKDDLRIRRLWHLPRAAPPTSVTTGNPSTDPINPNDTINSSFFQELDQKMGENLRATIARPNTNALLASLPSTTPPITGLYDPIDDLDGIIDTEDVDMTFHDPLNELYDEELLEVANPNLRLPRPKIDSKPTGLFSFLKWG